MGTDLKGPLPEDLRLPHPVRLDPARQDYTRILQAHQDAMTRADAGYADPSTGCFVFTAQALWERGCCCESGCRHCPFIERPHAEG